MMSKDKKVLVGLSYSLEIGGAERMMLTILNYSATQNFEVHLILFKDSGELRKELSSDIKLHKLDRLSVTKGMPKCLKLIKQISPDVVFSGIGHLNLALAPFLPIMKLLLPQTKWIARETNIVSIENSLSKYPKLFDFLYRYTYQNYNTIVAQSEDMREDILNNYFKTNKVVLINNPIDVEKVESLAKGESLHSFDKNKINLLSVSRLREQKKHHFMLETLTYLPTQYHLTIIGSGEKESFLKELTIKLNLQERVTFLGHQPNPYIYMKRADLFLLTSQREGFPNVLLEANLLGLPIVAFASLGGITEIVEEGVNGLLAPYHDCKALAKKIQKASSIEFNREKIIKRTIQRYSKENIMQKYKNIFNK